MSDRLAQPGYWVISDESLLEMLRRAQNGESPEILLTEEYANSNIDHGPETDDQLS